MQKSAIGILGGLAVAVALSACGTAQAGQDFDEGCINQRTGEVVDPYYCDRHDVDLIWYYPPHSEHIVFVPGQRVTVINKGYYSRPSNVTIIKQKTTINNTNGAKIPPYTPAKLPPAQVTNKPAPAAPKPAAPAPNPNVTRGGFGVPNNNAPAPKPAPPAPKPPAPAPPRK